MEKYTYFTTELYPDCEQHKMFIKLFEETHAFGFQMAYILHDKDIVTDVDVEEHANDEHEYPYKVGDKKKTHWHCLMKMPYPTTLERVKKALTSWIGNTGGVQEVYSPLIMSLYLTHNDVMSRCTGKYVYDESEIKGDVEIVLKKDKGQSISGLKKIIDDWTFDDDYNTTFSDLILYIDMQGYSSYVKSLGYIGTRMLDDACTYKKELKLRRMNNIKFGRLPVRKGD